MSARQRNIRKKKALSEDEEDDKQQDAVEEANRAKLEETKLIQKLRKRTGGLDADKLAAPVQGGQAAELDVGQDDHHNELMAGAYVKATAVAASLNEDDHMKAFIEAELAKRLGKAGPGEERDPKLLERMKAEAELYTVPEQYKSAMDHEVVIPGLITTITEVPLTMEQRLKNIEQTEAIKRKMLTSNKRGLALPGKDEEEEEEDDGKPGKMRRGALPATFGRMHERKTKDQRKKEEEEMRYMSERRPLKQ